ncbi:MAG: hypothetical protein ACOY31_01755 [Bacillota bacterium]
MEGFNKLHAWMERNLERPFVEAEMLRAEPTEKSGRLSSFAHLAAAAGMIVMVCWLTTLAVV